MPKILEVMQEIKFDERNYRKHSKKNKSIIKKSLKELGAGRSVVIDSEDYLVAGNGVYEQAQALKMPVRVVETDGSDQEKVMNTTFYLMPYVYRGERGVQDNDTSLFCSVKNEGLFCGSTRDGVVLIQMPSAKQNGGLTDLYNECKLLNKSLVVPIQYPSAVYAEKQQRNGGRLHHKIVYRNLSPRVIKFPQGRGNIRWNTFEEDCPFTNDPKKRNYKLL